MEELINRSYDGCKNHIFTMRRINLLPIILFVFIFFACSKSSVEERNGTSNTSQNITVSDRDGTLSYGYITNGRFVFESPDKFESYVLSLQGQNLDNVEAAFGIQSFRKYSNGNAASPIIDDVYFASAINKDGILQVGTDAFKMCPAERKVLVYRNANESKVLQLKNTTIAGGVPPGMLVFNFEDDAFDMLDNPTGVGQWWCGDGCAHHDKDLERLGHYCDAANGSADFKYKLKLKYNAFTIWHSLKIKFKHRCQDNCDDGTVSSGNADAADFDLRWVASWKKRCRDSGSAQREFIVCDVPGICGNNWPEASADYEHVFYNGIRCLSSFDLKGQARLSSKCSGSTAIITTEELHIEGD